MGPGGPEMRRENAAGTSSVRGLGSEKKKKGGKIGLWAGGSWIVAVLSFSLIVVQEIG